MLGHGHAVLPGASERPGTGNAVAGQVDAALLHPHQLGRCALTAG